jgi:hypothetical protein
MNRTRGCTSYTISDNQLLGLASIVILAFLQRGDWLSIYSIVFKHRGPPLCSSGQSSLIHIQTSGFDSQYYQIFWEVVGLERGPLSLVSTTEELLERKSCGSGLEIREYGRRNLSLWPRGTPLSSNLALTSPTSGCRSRTQATIFF